MINFDFKVNMVFLTIYFFEYLRNGVFKYCWIKRYHIIVSKQFLSRFIFSEIKSNYADKLKIFFVTSKWSSWQKLYKLKFNRVNLFNISILFYTRSISSMYEKCTLTIIIFILRTLRFSWIVDSFHPFSLILHAWIENVNCIISRMPSNSVFIKIYHFYVYHSHLHNDITRSVTWQYYELRARSLRIGFEIWKCRLRLFRIRKITADRECIECIAWLCVHTCRFVFSVSQIFLFKFEDCDVTDNVSSDLKIFSSCAMENLMIMVYIYWNNFSLLMSIKT